MEKNQGLDGMSMEILFKGIWRLDFDRFCAKVQEIANLYCEIWKEPPWNEEFWKSDEVIEDIKNQINKPGACLLAVDDKDWRVVGFSWGYQVNTGELSEISGIPELKWKEIIGEKIAFYIDELGVDKDYRRQGVGKWLTQELLEEAVTAGIWEVTKNGIKHVILRTDVKATAARNLYKKLGFRELDLVDAKYSDRTYWLKGRKPRKNYSKCGNCPFQEAYLRAQTSGKPWESPPF